MTRSIVEIRSERFQLKELTPSDVGETYLSWFENDDVKDYIYAAREEQTVEKLKQYVKDKFSATDCLFLGIFHEGRHIGNLKFEPLDIRTGVAVMGIMVGDTEWRGRGVAGEVILAGGNYLLSEMNIRTIQLGVDRANVNAIRAYEKLGFKEESVCSHIEPDAQVTVMSLALV